MTTRLPTTLDVRAAKKRAAALRGMKALYARRAAAGVCLGCEKPPVPGRRRCAVCLARVNEWAKRSQKKRKEREQALAKKSGKV